jgi:hypothetical protein
MKAIEFVMNYEAYVKQIEAVVRPEFKPIIERDLRRVYKLWSQHKYNEADEVAWKMDTAGRENIPDSVWSDIQRKIGAK